MTTGMSKWVVPAFGFVLGLLVSAAELGRQASPLQAAVAFAIVAGYAIALRVLQSRSDVASLPDGVWPARRALGCRSPSHSLSLPT